MADGPACFRQDSSCLAVLRIPLNFLIGFQLQGLHLLRPGFRSRFFSSLLPYRSFNPGPWTGFGFLPFRSPLLRNHCCFFSSGYLDVSSSPGTSLQAMYSPADDSPMYHAGFPHSTPPLLRFLTASRSFSQFSASFASVSWPRHSPYALPYLISGSRVFEMCSFQELFFTHFLSLSYNLHFRPFLLCLFFLVAQFQRSITLRVIRPLKTKQVYSLSPISSSSFFLLRKEGDPSPRSRRDTLLRLNPQSSVLPSTISSSCATGFGRTNSMV